MIKFLILKNTLFEGRPFSFKIMFALFLIVLLISFHKYFLGKKLIHSKPKIECTHYNNYLIFSKSFYHLISNKDLYTAYPDEYWDYYKYSPTFALFMAPFAVLPVLFGLIFWNLLNAFVLFLGIWTFPRINNKTKIFMLSFILIEMITSVQNAQSNSLIAGLMIISFNFFEKRKNFWALFFITLTVYIKLFGIIVFTLILLYPKKLKSILYSLFWLSILGLLPLMVISAHQLFLLYRSWLNLIVNDHNTYYGLSVMGWLQTWFGLEKVKNIIVPTGLILLLLPLLKKGLFSSFRFRIFLFSSILIWVVIFNHKAESPTFIIAVAGVALWLFSQKFNYINFTLAFLVLILTELSPTDLFPAFLRNNWIIPYDLKAIPCILTWFKISYDLLTINTNPMAK